MFIRFVITTIFTSVFLVTFTKVVNAVIKQGLSGFREYLSEMIFLAVSTVILNFVPSGLPYEIAFVAVFIGVAVPFGIFLHNNPDT